MRYSLLTLFFTFCFSLSAQVDAFQQEIIELLNCNGTQEEYSQAYEDVFVKLKRNFETANVPITFWDELKKDKANSVKEVTRFLTFAYRNHFSRDDIATMTRFYETEVAQKMLKSVALTEEENKKVLEFQKSKVGQKEKAKQAALTKDITEIAGHWSRDLFSEKMSALIKAGYFPRQ
jgi:hypothetical protein